MSALRTFCLHVLLCISLCLFAARVSGQTNTELNYTSPSNHYMYGYEAVCFADTTTVVTGGDYDGSDSTFNVLLMKLRPNGQHQWTKAYKITDTTLLDCHGAHLIRKPTGGYIISAFAITTVNRYLLISTDTAGNVQWYKLYEVPGFHMTTASGSIDYDGDGYLICSDVRRFQFNDTWSHVFKIDLSGNVVWSRKFNNYGKYSNIAALKVCPGGGFVFGGTSPDTSYNIFISRADALGNLLWTKFYKTNTPLIQGWDLCLTADHGFAVCGTEDPAFEQPMILKTDSAGNVQWIRRYTFPAFDAVARSIVQRPDKGFALSVGSSTDNYLLVTDSLGGAVSASIIAPGEDMHNVARMPGGRLTALANSMTSVFSVNLFRTDSSCSTGCSTPLVVSDVVLPVTIHSTNIDTTIVMTPVQHTLVAITVPVTQTSCNLSTGLLPAASENFIRAYPNPSSGFIRLENIPSASITELYNLQGQCIRQSSLSGKNELDLRDCANGVYFLRVRSENNELLYSQRIVLIKE